MKKHLFRIKKTRDGMIYSTPSGIFISLAYISFPLLGIFFYWKDGLTTIKYMDFFDIFFLGLFTIFTLCFSFFGLQLLITEIRIKKVRNFKYNGKGIVKRGKVSCIGKTTGSKKDIWGNELTLYYVEVKDNNTSYYSNGCHEGTYGGVSTSDLREIYEWYGYSYNRKDTEKQKVLNEIDKFVSEKEYEKDNGTLLKKLSSKGLLSKAISDRKIVEQGYIIPYWEINGHRISVGDEIDIYIDPKNEKIYRVDIDFLFEK